MKLRPERMLKPRLLPVVRAQTTQRPLSRDFNSTSQQIYVAAVGYHLIQVHKQSLAALRIGVTTTSTANPHHLIFTMERFISSTRQIVIIATILGSTSAV